MHRFVVAPEMLAADPIVLTGEVARQIAVVLRLHSGEQVVLLDGAGTEVVAELTAVAARRASMHPLERRPNHVEAGVALHLYPALLRGPRFELVLQKATELGVASITPFVSRRSVARPTGGGVPERWRAIVREAVEQSGRGRLPELAASLDFAAACRTAACAERAILLAERGGADLAMLLRDRPRSLALMVGPEGGFEPAEIASAAEAGVTPAWLGPRILRAETAALAACAAAYCVLGEWTPALASNEAREPEGMRA